MSVAPLVVNGIGWDSRVGILSNLEWSSQTLTYAFANSAQDYPEDYSVFNEPGNDFAPLPDTARAHLRRAFWELESLIGISITEAASVASADLVIGQSSVPFIALAYYPSTLPAGGDIWFNLDSGFLNTLNTEYVNIQGAYEWATVLHEIGHAVGLKHGHEGASQNPTSLPAEFDALEFAVMTYRSFVGDLTVDGYNIYPNNFPQSFMVLDIAALQSIYGANYDTRAGDTTYRFDPENGALQVDEGAPQVPQAPVVFRTLWDGGGTDHLDLSAFQTDLAIDLRPGQATDLDVNGNALRARLSADEYAIGHIYQSLSDDNDPRSLIENATAGAGDDMLVGNDADNRLMGGAGTNTLFGGAGSDVFAGSAADLAGDKIVDFEAPDRIEVSTASAQLTLGTTLLNETTLRFGDHTALQMNGLAAFGLLRSEFDAGTLSITAAPNGNLRLSDGDDSFVSEHYEAITVQAGEGNDIVLATIHDDLLLGGQGADMLIAHAGNDRIVGGDGADLMSGGAGIDTFVIAADTSDTFILDRIKDFNIFEDVLELQGLAIPNLANATDGIGGALLQLQDTQFLLFEGLSAADISDITITSSQNQTELLGRDPARYLTESEDSWQIGDGGTGQEVFGLGGSDILLGGSGEDALFGGVGADVLVGDTGNDTLDGGSGSDSLTGGAGADTFVFSPDQSSPFTADRITDFDLKHDQLRFDGFGFTDLAQLQFAPSANGVTAVLNQNHFLVLEGFENPADLLLNETVFFT